MHVLYVLSVHVSRRRGTATSDAALPQNTLRDPVTHEMSPRNRIVFTPGYPTSSTTAGKKPRLPSRLPEGCENNVWIVRIKNNIDPARIFVFGQNLRPGLPTVAGPKYSAFCVSTKCMTKRRYEDDILISWINN